MPNYLGQHFLKNKKILKRITSFLNLKHGDIVLEIGPGHGELTRELLGHPVTVIAIERDKTLVDFLNQNFQSTFKSQFSKLEIINGNALEALPDFIKNSKLKIKNSNYKIAGNIPYYITGHLLRILSELEHKPEKIVLLIQKEVAERITAKPPKMNLLSAITQSWAKAEIGAFVGRKDFSPPPKVDSAVIILTPLENTGEYESYYQFVRHLFKQPRKTILNNLTSGAAFLIDKNALISKMKKIGIDPSNRPQNLSLEDIKQLCKVVYNYIDE